MSKSKAVQDKNLPVTIDFAADAGKGIEGADADSYAIPFISILQALSPVITDKSDPTANIGDMRNSVTGKNYKEILFIPCAFERRINLWRPRNEGGGFRGSITAAELLKLQTSGQLKKGKKNEDIDPEGNVLRDTRNHYVLVQQGDYWSPALITMAGTQIKKSRRLMAQIADIKMEGPSGSYNPPSFSHVYKAKSSKENNAEGTWFGWNIEIVQPIRDLGIYQLAKLFHDQVRAGKVETAQPTADADEGQF